MAKHQRRRKFRRYIRGVIDIDYLLGSALAAKTLKGQALGDVVADTTWLSSIVATHTMQNYTTGQTRGPITVGVAHSDYSDAEIEEWYERTLSWDEGNLVRQEQAKRKIKLIGTFRNPTGPAETAELNDGKPIRTKCNWRLNENDTLRFWAYNNGTGALSTTDPSVGVHGHANLWPQ